jgi:tetratricopeptide (TPR) repeat protein
MATRPWPVLAAALVLIAGCVTVPTPRTADLLVPLTDATGEPLHVPAPVIAADDVLAVSDEMRAFLTEHGAYDASGKAALRKLAWLLGQHAETRLRYDAVATLSAAEAFAQRTGNCLSLSMVFVAMARELGLDARFQDVDTAPVWDTRRGVVFNLRHVNVVSRVRGETFVLDFLPADASATLSARPMRDAEAIAHYHNNIGTEALTDGDEPLAFAHLAAAIDAAPQIPFLWANLGLLYQRHGQPQAALAVLRHAVAIDPRNAGAHAHLANVLMALDRPEQAQQHLQRVSALRAGNPWFQLAHAERAIADGDTVTASLRLDDALALRARDARFYFRAADLARRLGRDDEARALQARHQRLVGGGSRL